MLFDGYESGTSVQDCIDIIETLAAVRKPGGMPTNGGRITASSRGATAG